MVILPLGFTPTKYAGYYWDTVTQRLYSTKVDGNLYEMKMCHPNHFNHLRSPAYRVCHKGIRRVLMLSDLQKLQVVDTVLGLSEKNK